MAIKTGQRPTAFILRDKYAGYRDYNDARWDTERAPYINANEYTRWDYLLASVAQLLEDYTNPANGQLRWFDESDKVEWDIRSSYSGYDAALDKDDKELEPGETRYAVPVYDENDPPTINEWLEAIEDEENHRPPGYKNSGHQEWELTDAREAAQAERAEMAKKLRDMIAQK